MDLNEIACGSGFCTSKYLEGSTSATLIFHEKNSWKRYFFGF